MEEVLRFINKELEMTERLFQHSINEGRSANTEEMIGIKGYIRGLELVKDFVEGKIAETK